MAEMYWLGHIPCERLLLSDLLASLTLTGLQWDGLWGMNGDPEKGKLKVSKEKKKRKERRKRKKSRHCSKYVEIYNQHSIIATMSFDMTEEDLQSTNIPGGNHDRREMDDPLER